MKYGIAIWQSTNLSGNEQAYRVLQYFAGNPNVINTVGELNPFDTWTGSPNIIYPTFFIIRENGQYFDLLAMYHGVLNSDGYTAQNLDDQILIKMMQKALSGQYDNPGNAPINESGNSSLLTGNGGGGLGLGFGIGNYPSWLWLLIAAYGGIQTSRGKSPMINSAIAALGTINYINNK